MIEAVYSTKILESPKWSKWPIPPRIFNGYLLKLSRFDHDSKYEALNTINKTIDYILDRLTTTPRLPRADMFRQLCELVSDNYSWPSVDQNLVRTGGSIQKCTTPQDSLAAAAYLGLISLANALLVEGVKENHYGFFGTALLNAIRKNHTDIAVLIIEKGEAKCYWSHVFHAGLKGNRKLIDITVNHAEGWFAREATSVALKGAVASGNFQTICYVISKYFCQNPVTQLSDDKRLSQVLIGQQPSASPLVDFVLNEAAVYGHMAVVQSALAHGASVRSVGMSTSWQLPKGMTRAFEGEYRNPLVSAAIHGWKDIFLMLFAQFLRNEHYKEVPGEALFHAVKRGWIAISDILLSPCYEHRVSLTYIRNNFLILIKSGQTSAIQLLLNRRMKLLSADKRSCEEAYRWAKDHGYTSICQSFIANGCADRAWNLEGSSQNIIGVVE